MDRQKLLKRKMIKIKEIHLNSDNPREAFKLYDQSLKESIEEINMKDPIKVRPISDEDEVTDGISFIVVDGDRRFTILQEMYPEMHLLKVGQDILIEDLTREQAYDVNVALNMQRQNYDLREECNIVEHYNEQGLSQREIAKKCNRSQRWIQDRLKVLAADPEIQLKIFKGEMDLTSLRPQSESMDSLEEVTDVGQPEGEPLSGPAKSDIKPPKFIVNTPLFDDLQAAFPNIEFSNIRHSGAFIGFAIEDENELTNLAIANWITKQQKVEDITDENDRTTIFTKDQYDAILEADPVWDDDIQGRQTIGDDVTIIWKSVESKMDAIQWLLDSRVEFPLTRDQLEQYTDLSSEEIQQIVEKDIQQEAEERIQEPEPKGSIREAMMNVSQQEYASFIPSIRALISDEEPQKNGEILIFFRSWNDEALARRWLNPSITWPVPKLAFPATIMHSTDLQDILTSDKLLKEHFPHLYQELKGLQNFTKNLKQISVRTLENITKSQKRLDIFKEDLKKDLKTLKDQRRISGGKEQHQKICQSCLQPKWMEPNRDICGNCELAKRKQKKNSAATATSGGAK